MVNLIYEAWCELKEFLIVLKIVYNYPMTNEDKKFAKLMAPDKTPT